MIFSENGTPGEGYYNVYHPTGYVQERLMKGFELADFVPEESWMRVVAILHKTHTFCGRQGEPGVMKSRPYWRD